MAPGTSVRLNGAALRAIRSRTIDPHTGFPYTVSGFAGSVGCQQPHITLLEQDARKASRTLLAKIVTALDVPPAAVMWAPPPQGKTVGAEAVA